MHPSTAFKDYFSEIVRKDLARGIPHPTLGPKLTNGVFGVSGRKTFPSLVRRYGILPDDSCVDYGCGTLRVGVHAITYLSPHRYWGMDISELFLAEGLKLIGSDLAREKAPHLRVISRATIAEAAAAKPKLVFSANVLLHVHPDELSEYLTNILTIIGGTGVGAITGSWNTSRTSQMARQTWVHSEKVLRVATRSAGGQIVFYPTKTIGEGSMSGLMELR